MTTSLYDLSVPTFLQTVRAVRGFLDRVASHCAQTGAKADDLVGFMNTVEKLGGEATKAPERTFRPNCL